MTEIKFNPLPKPDPEEFRWRVIEEVTKMLSSDKIIVDELTISNDHDSFANGGFLQHLLTGHRIITIKITDKEVLEEYHLKRAELESRWK